MDNLGISIILQGNNLQRLLSGFFVTLQISIISILISVLLGIIFGIVMNSKQIWIQVCSKIYLETVRIIPIVVWLFIFYFGLSRILQIRLPAQSIAVLVFSLWGTAEMGDIVRGAISSLPRQQIESAKAVGLTKIQIYQYITIPQAVRRLLPAAINLSTRMIKTTSLVVLIGVIDVLKVGQQIIELSVFSNSSAAFWIYGFVFFLYFIICYPISLLSRYLEVIWSE